MGTTCLYIDGRTEEGQGKRIPIINPALGEAEGELAFASESQLKQAVKSAETAFESWQWVSPVKRSRILFKFKALLEKHHKELAKMVTNEHGKTFDDAMGSVMRGIEVVEHNLAVMSQLRGDHSLNVAGNIDCHTMRYPLGVCAGVSPFNFPVMVPMWMVIPAIACGNTFILKPSEQTPNTPVRLMELLTEAGLPDGVVNLVHGDKKSVDFLLEAPEIKAITAVASTFVADYIYQKGIQNGKRAHTFGGAKNHCLIAEDSDLDFVANAVSGAAFGAAGERCMALSVAVVVGDERADEFVGKVLENAKKIKVAPGLSEGADMGPLVSEAHLNKVKSYIAEGVNEGAELLLDGRTLDLSPGYFLGPTLFDRVSEEMSIHREEIFGPVLSVVRVNSFDEGVALINRHRYGNGSAIFTNCGYLSREFSNRVQAGMVGVNVPIPVPVAWHPFGGWKDSVFGDLNMHGDQSFQFYTKLKTVTTRWPKQQFDLEKSAYVMPTT
jgi:malonate-semialdehyde dehydrogenase (acetylating)/methylmalonate-semialdehyde dehydrogenase